MLSELLFLKRTEIASNFYRAITTINIMKPQKLLRLVSEMLKNSKKSDRELAGILGVSQPTVSRTRARIEKEYIKTYTIIPDFQKLGYNIMAFIMAKLKPYSNTSSAEKIMQQSKEWITNHPNIILSLHKTYSDYAKFVRSFNLDWGASLDNFEAFLVSIGSEYTMRDFDLKYLAEDI